MPAMPCPPAAHDPPLATHVLLYHAAFLFVLAVNLPLIIVTARGEAGWGVSCVRPGAALPRSTFMACSAAARRQAQPCTPALPCPPALQTPA